MFRRDALLALGGYDESLRHYEDWDLLLRASREGWVTVVDDPLALTVQLPSTPKPLQNDALARLARKHLPVEQGHDRRRLQAALAYERASMHYRDGARVAFLMSLLEAAALQPIHITRRAAGRLLRGTP